MSTLNGLPSLDDLLRRRLPRVPRLGEIPAALGGDYDRTELAGNIDLGGGPTPGFPNLDSYAAPVNSGPPALGQLSQSGGSFGGGGAGGLFDAPTGIERRGEHPRLRALVEEGPDAIEAELRDFIANAPPEDIAQNPRAWWQTALEWLDLPRNAAFNLVNNILGEPVKPSSKEEFAGLRKIYGADVLRTMGWRPDSTIGKVGQFVAGLLLDFAADPVTWLSGLGGVARGTLKTAATGADDLGREIAAARRVGKGLTVGEAHVKPGALDRLGELARADEGFFPEIARAEGFPSAVERAAAQIPPEDLYRGRWGVGAETHAAKNIPLGHLVAGPAILGGKAAGALVEGAGRAASAIPKIGPYVGPPLELAGRAIQKPIDLVAGLSDAVGTPFSRLPEAAAFKPFAEIPGVGKIAEAAAGLADIPAVQRAGEAVTAAAGKIGIGPGSALQQLVRRYVEQAERAKRYTEAEMREQVAPLLRKAARETGIAAEHLEPLYAMATEFLPQIRASAESGDVARMRAILDEQQSLVEGHLKRWYGDAKVVKATDQVMETLGKRVVPKSAPRLGPVAGEEPAVGGAAAAGAGAAARRSLATATAPGPLIDLKLPGTTYGRHSLSYKHGITGSAAEAAKYADETVTREAIDQVRKQLGGQPSRGDVFYHGTGVEGLTADRLDPLLGSHESLFGHGIYFTDNPEIAAGYARNRSRRRGTATIYEAALSPRKVLDLEQPITPEVAAAITQGAYDGPLRAVAAAAAREKGATPEAVLEKLAKATADLSHQEELPTSEFVEQYQDIAEQLQRLGYDALTHTGGRRPGRAPHKVMIVLDPGAVKRFEPRRGGQAPLVFVPVPSTSGADNQVPRAIAAKLAKDVGGTVAPDLLATGTYRSRRAKGRLESLANPRDFVAADAYELPAGARIILVDDTAKTGGTLRDAAAALREAGFDVAASIVGKSRPRAGEKISSTRAAELRTRAGAEAPILEAAIGRTIDDLTAPEAEALLAELSKPGTSARAVALKIENLREVPLPAGGRPMRGVVTPAGREAVTQRLIALHDDLQNQGLVGDVLADQAALRGAGADDIENALDAGYTFTAKMAGEARELQEALRGRGYKRLVGLVKVRRESEKAVAGQTGDDVIASLASAGETDPIARMAEGIIAHAEEQSGAGRIRRALDWIANNPQIATPEQKDLARRYAALTADDADIRKAARGKAGEIVQPENMAVGDRVSIAGEPHRVIKADETGVIVKDGEEIHLQPGEPLVVDRGSHEPDPLDLAVTQAVGRLHAEGVRVNVASVLGTLREMLPAATRDAELKRILGVAKLKGNRGQIDSRIEMALLRSGEGVRGVNWESILQRLEEVEAGKPGRLIPKIEQGHSLGTFIAQKRDPATGAATQARELTPLGRQALDAMRANLAAGGEPAQIGRLIERINVLESKFQMAKRAGQPVPRGIWGELSRKKQILGRMGRRLVDEQALADARAAALAADAERRALAAPSPRDLFAEPVAAVLEKMLELERKTQAEEAGKIAVGDISRNTERGVGYFPRVMGDAKTVAGKQYRADAMRWSKAWKDVVGEETLPAKGAGLAYGRTPYENLSAIIKAENKDRVGRGLPEIPLPDKDGDLATSLAQVLDRYPDLKPSHRHQMMRTFLRENMLHEINSLAEHTGIAFSTDPVKAWMSRRVASHYAVAGADFLRAIIANAVETGLAVAVKPKGPVPKGFDRIVDKRFGALAGNYAFATELVDQFKKFTRTMDQPHVILRAFDWATSQWRTMVLGVFPYTMTNLLSGVFQSNQFDAFSQKAWAAGKRLMEDLHLERTDGRTLSQYIDGLPKSIGDLTVKEFYNALAIEHGALGKGNYGVELEQAVKDNFATGWGVADAVASSFSGERRRDKLLAGLAGIHRDDQGRLRWDLSEQAYFKAFRAANVAVEDWMKISFILERLRKGDRLPDAVQKGRLALNQSADLTDFERATFRRILPFWGWMKGNAVLQMTMAAARPQVTALVGKIRGDLEASFAADENLPGSLRPRHVAEELGAQLSGGAKPDFINLTRLYPVKELGTTPLAAGNITDATLETLIGGLNPILKAPLESAINRDLYWDRPIEEYDGQRRRWLGMDLPPGVKRLARMIRPLNVAEQVSWRGVPTTAGEAGFTAAQTLGLRTFPVDVQRQVFEREREINTQLAAVMRDFSRARMRAEQAGRDWRRDPEVQRIGRIYSDLRGQRDRLPLKQIRGLTADSRRAYRARREELRDFALAS